MINGYKKLKIVEKPRDYTLLEQNAFVCRKFVNL